jgi:hypothetical protein
MDMTRSDQRSNQVIVLSQHWGRANMMRWYRRVIAPPHSTKRKVWVADRTDDRVNAPRVELPSSKLRIAQELRANSDYARRYPLIPQRSHNVVSGLRGTPSSKPRVRESDGANGARAADRNGCAAVAAALARLLARYSTAASACPKGADHTDRPPPGPRAFESLRRRPPRAPTGALLGPRSREAIEAELPYFLRRWWKFGDGPPHEPGLDAIRSGLKDQSCRLVDVSY